MGQESGETSHTGAALQSPADPATAKLEDGPLRRELGLASVPPPSPPPASPSPPPAYRATLRFTGTGAEYFRIWVVHLLLTLLTLGLYSAWAKVRKARWPWSSAAWSC